MFSHRAFNPGHERRVARRERRFDRLEPVEIGGQRQFLCSAPVAALERGEALRKLGASDRERARGLLHQLIGVAAQIGEHRVGFRLPNATRKRGGGERDQGFQIGNSCPQARVRLPQAFAFDRCASVEAKLPARNASAQR